jgi:hypothetical protein
MIVLLIRYWYVWLVSLTSVVYFLLLSANSTTLLHATLYSVGLIVVLLLVYLQLYRKHAQRIVIGTTLLGICIGMVGVYLLVETALIRSVLAVSTSLLFAATLYIPKRLVAQLAHEYKPWRRMFASIITIACCSLLALLFGLDTFFQAPAFVWYLLGGGGVMGWLGYVSLRLYHPEPTPQLAVWAALIGALGVELMWALSRTSLGYLVIGFVLAWMWHVSVVLVRFHLSARGITWRKQYLFLFMTATGILVVLLFSNWI